jgi:hypothetical protein
MLVERIKQILLLVIQPHYNIFWNSQKEFVLKFCNLIRVEREKCSEIRV